MIIDAGSSGSRIFVYKYYFRVPNSSNSANNSKEKTYSNLNDSKLDLSQKFSIDYLKVELARDPDNSNKTLVRKISPGKL
ncbi:unnamed protein product [Gordionus sp. m RMFG-2023]